jgi:ubiquinone/menaquinone biosynthesis C-methylase UbiE
MTHDDSKARSQDRFGRFAASYVTSDVHRGGSDLDRLIELTQAQPGWMALDIATGGGHTALRLAPLVAQVVAADLTMPMLVAAREYLLAQAATNVRYTATDAERLAFASESFDLVTCRIAPHHFPDCFRFVLECARVLRPGGLLVIEDHLLPEDDRAARYIDAFECLRDPSHHRAFSAYEWRGMLLDAGLSMEHMETVAKRGMRLIPWAERQGCEPQVIERLQIMLAQAPGAVRAFMQPRCIGTADAEFDHQYILLVGRKI